MKMKRLTAIRAIAIIIVISGLILIPGVSSSKNRSNPALAAGIGASRFLRFSRAVDMMFRPAFGVYRELRFHRNEVVVT